MMDRRIFLGVAGAGVVAVPTLVSARLACGPFVPPGVQQCMAGLDSSLAHATATGGGQQLSQWCWAACIAMVFRYYGMNVPQAQIVQQTFGQTVNLPSQPGQILANLNRQWIDASGCQFGVSGDAFTANPVTASQDLAQDMPLIIGTMGHAMVLTSITYVRDQFGNGNVTAAVVRDPWPGRGRRVLSPQEWHGTSFLVRIRVHPT